VLFDVTTVIEVPDFVPILILFVEC